MCQPAPLARCANQATKDGKKLETDLGKNHQQRVQVEEKIEALEKEAKSLGFTPASIVDPETPGLEELNKLREDKTRLEKENFEIIKDTWEQELHYDATPKGIELLEKGKDMPGYSDARLKNANALNEWHKKIRNLKDSNGNKITSKEANLEDRHKAYMKEFSNARDNYQSAQGAAAESKRRIDIINKRLAVIPTETVAVNDPRGLKSGTRLAVHAGDAHEVALLEKQKESLIARANSAHYDQILERAKMNRLRKAIQNNKKTHSKAVVAERLEKDKHIMDDASDTFNRTQKALYERSKTYMGDGSEEFTRLTSKAYAVQTGAKILEKHRKANPGNERKAAEAFRSEVTYLHKEAVENAENAVDRNDEFEEAQYRGLQGGYSLLLDKVRFFR